MIRNFHELDVWRKADDLAHRVFDLTEAFPRSYLFDVTSQLRRAALSVPTNLAEGCATTHTKELVQFINIARRSASETQYLLRFALRRELITVQTYEQLVEAYDEVHRMLNGLVSSLRRSQIVKGRRSIVSLFVFVWLCTGHWPLVTSHCQAQVPHLIRYQGQAVDTNSIGLEGLYTITFRLCDSATGSTYVWEEVQPNVPISGGHFSVLLGSVNPLNSVSWDQPLWLSIRVGEISSLPNAPLPAELLPRQRITSVPTALLAEQLDGPIRTVGNNVGIGTTSPGQRLVVNGATVISNGASSWLYNAAIIDYDPGQARIIAGDAAGNDSALTFWTNETAVPGDGTEKMRIAANGHVGIGTTNPGAILAVQQTSPTDPIADSWTVYPSDSQHKIILSNPAPTGYLDQLKAIPLYTWKRAPLVSDADAMKALGTETPTPQELAAKKQALSLAKAQLPKFTTTRVGLLLDDATIPSEILVLNPDGTKAGIDLLGYVGLLHAALKEAALKIEELESRVNALSSH